MECEVGYRNLIIGSKEKLILCYDFLVMFIDLMDF